jgi:hypothetical protein
VCTLKVDLVVPRDDFDSQAFERATNRLVEIIGDYEDLRLTVTTDFRGAVRRVVTDADYAAAYEQERDFAVAMAKTIPQDDGSTDLVIDARIFSLAAEPGSAERAFEHEGLHVAMRLRGESLHDIRERRGLVQGSAAGLFASMAGMSCEEYRVERTVLASEPSRVLDDVAWFGETMCRFDSHIRRVSRQYQLDHDVGAIHKEVMEAFHALATWTAYVSAFRDAADQPLTTDVPNGVGTRVLGAAWHALSGALRMLPPADAQCSREDLDRFAATVEECLVEWLRQIGFSLTDTAAGELHFGVLNPAVWVL